MSSAVAEVRRLVEGASRITVLTGAGISTDSGIPDFRGPNGVWTKNPAAERMFTLQNYVADPEVRRAAWQSRKTHTAWTAEPNAAHHALVDLERSGRLVAIVTQNIDGLHQLAGSDPDRIIEIHGTMREVACLSCAGRWPMAEVLARLDDGEEDPSCALCGGILKSATISFGQALVPEVLDAAVDATVAADLMLAIGSSLTVRPAAGLCDLAVEEGARLVVINAQETPYDELAARSGGAVVRDPVGEVLPTLVADLSPVG
jgi:NAD-dependent deacetylase